MSYNNLYSHIFSYAACRNAFLLFLFGLNLILTSCGTQTTNELTGVVNIWHDWGEEESIVLDQVLSSFTDIHPGVTIRATAIEPGQLRTRFQQSAAAGLGPDLLFGPSSWIMPLKDAGLIQSVDHLLPSDIWERYSPPAVETVRYMGSTYGVPESLRLQGLYYNKRQVDDPAQTLDALVAEANLGRRVGISPAFVDAFWGVQAFGGQLFDEDERVVLDNGGFANWLAWLKSTLDVPNIVLDKDPQTLTALFTEGELAYLVAGSWMRKELQNALGENLLGVAPLPSGPIEAAGPFLETDALMFSKASSPRQLRVATVLADFITNAEQQTVLMRRAGRIPTSTRVRNNPSVDPVANAFRVQGRTAVPLRNTHNMDVVLEQGNSAVNRALQGVAEPIVVAQDLTLAINQANGFPTSDNVVDRCMDSGVLTVWYGEDQPATDSLLAIGENFARACSNVKVEFRAHPLTEMPEQIMTATSSNQPDLMLIPNEWIVPLALGRVLQPIDAFIDPQLLQSFYPGGVESMRYNSQLYGIPFILMPQALYFNASLIAEPAQDLSALAIQGQSGKRTALSLSFVDTYWGISAYGDTLFSEDGRVVLDQGGTTDWLRWLADGQENAGLLLDTRIERLRERFIAGEAAYLVDRPQALAELEKSIGADLRVANLPGGPATAATSILLTTGFALKNGLSTEQVQLALKFVAFATNVENQTLLADTERLLPANIGIAIAPTDPLAVFADQVESSAVYPNRVEMVAAEQLGKRLYTHLLEDSNVDSATGERNSAEDTKNEDPENIVRAVIAEINNANGFEPIVDSGDVSEDETLDD